MFQAIRSDQTRFQLWITIGTLVSIATAMAVTFWIIIEIQQEQAAIDEILRIAAPNIASNLQLISEKLRWQLPFTVLVLVILIGAASTRIAIAQAYAVSQQSLRDTKTLAWHTFASIDQGLITTNVDGLITSANPEAHELLGLAGEFVGKPLREVCVEENPLAEIIKRVLASGHAEHDQDFALPRRGHLLRLRAHCNLLRNDGNQVSGVVLHVRDITERHLIEQQLRRMERYMGLGSVVASLHHEINNPLSALALHLQLLDERLSGRDDAEVNDTMRILQTEIGRITGVLNGFREYASVLTLNRGATDLRRIVKTTIDLIRPQAKRQRVRITSNIAADPGSLRGDSGLLEQVLLNLILNALEAMPNGGDLQIDVKYNSSDVTLSVKDSGAGISPDLQSRIFDPFFTTKQHGSGMGLAFCDKIVREHGGQINYETSDAGTLFQVTLPRSADA